MTIEQKLEILKRAMEMGADVSVGFHDTVSENDAVLLAKKFPELGFDKKSHNRLNWLKHIEGNFEAIIFYEKSNEDRKAELRAELAELERVE